MLTAGNIRTIADSLTLRARDSASEQLHALHPVTRQGRLGRLHNVPLPLLAVCAAVLHEVKQRVDVQV